MNEWRYSHETTVGCKKSIIVKYYYNKNANVKKVYSNGREEIIDKVTKGKNGERIYITIAKLFPEICGQWYEGCQVDHINCDRTDNRAENLRCCSCKENMRNTLTVQHCKEAAKQRWEDGVYDNIDYSNYVPWNKGMKEQYKLGPHSKEWNEKIGKANKGNSACGRPGQKHSLEQNKKQSERMKGKNNPMYGKTPWNKGMKGQYKKKKKSD